MVSGFVEQILSKRDLSFALVERLHSRKQEFFSMDLENKSRTASVNLLIQKDKSSSEYTAHATLVSNVLLLFSL